MIVFAESLHSNGRLCWLHNFGFLQTCNNNNNNNNNNNTNNNNNNNLLLQASDCVGMSSYLLTCHSLYSEADCKFMFILCILRGVNKVFTISKMYYKGSTSFYGVMLKISSIEQRYGTSLI
jgi:hypothetical protein